MTSFSVMASDLFKPGVLCVGQGKDPQLPQAAPCFSEEHRVGIRKWLHLDAEEGVCRRHPPADLSVLGPPLPPGLPTLSLLLCLGIIVHTLLIVCPQGFTYEPLTAVPKHWV